MKDKLLNKERLSIEIYPFYMNMVSKLILVRDHTKLVSEVTQTSSWTTTWSTHLQPVQEPPQLPSPSYYIHALLE